MRKISIILVMGIILVGLTSCVSNDQGMSISEKESSTKGITEKRIETVKTTETEETKAELTAVEIQTEVTGEWSCEANVSENEDGTLTVNYDITDPDGNKTHSFTEKPDFDRMWYEMYKENGGELCKFIDFNFDGHVDIITQQYGAFVNQYYNIRIWNDSVGEFELNQDYMGLPNPEVNNERKQIFSTNFDRGLGNYNIYEVKNGELIRIAAIEVVINNDGTFEYSETIGDGERKVINSMEEVDPIWEGYNLYIES